MRVAARGRRQYPWRRLGFQLVAVLDNNGSIATMAAMPATIMVSVLAAVPTVIPMNVAASVDFATNDLLFYHGRFG